MPPIARICAVTGVLRPGTMGRIAPQFPPRATVRNRRAKENRGHECPRHGWRDARELNLLELIQVRPEYNIPAAKHLTPVVNGASLQCRNT